MKNYYWRGIDIYGNKSSGSLLAENPDILKKNLLNKEIALLAFREKSFFLISIFNKIFKRKTSLKTKAFFFEQLYLLLNSGIELINALQITIEQIKEKQFKKIIVHVKQKVEQGESLASCMQQFGGTFNFYIINLIYSGELTGKLSFALDRIVKNLNQRLILMQKLRQASLLPIITLSFAVFLILGIFIFVMPQFELLFNSFEKKLPFATEYIFNISKALRSNKFLPYFLVFILLIVLVKYLLNLDAGKSFKDKIYLKIPVIGKILILYDLVIFLDVLAMFLESGIDIQNSLSSSIKTVKNSFIKNKLKKVEKLIIEGESFYASMSLEFSDFCNQDLLALIKVGEYTGSLDKMLKKSVNIYKNKLDSKIKFISTVFQPILLIFIGLIVVTLMLCVYLPIFSMGSIF